jgi:hypothetical protein
VKVVVAGFFSDTPISYIQLLCIGAQPTTYSEINHDCLEFCKIAIKNLQDHQATLGNHIQMNEYRQVTIMDGALGQIEAVSRQSESMKVKGNNLLNFGRSWKSFVFVIVLLSIYVAAFAIALAYIIKYHV